MPSIDCPECDRAIAMHELEIRTVATRDSFETTYRCPYCAADFEDVSGLL
ncbi:MAG: hypothetical protein U5K70_03440 [Halodesulfurarchaeum sp.]|nr:hypothetical protein [Halodesulfurarchaeum sp.]